MAICLKPDRDGCSGRSVPITDTARICIRSNSKSVAITIKDNLDAYSSSVNQASTINKVPHYLRDVHKNAFDPKLVSIGPIHWKKPQLSAMEEHKWRFLYRRVASSTKSTTTENSSLVHHEPSSSNSSTSSSTEGRNNKEVDVMIDTLATEMKNLESKTRNCYSEKFDHITTDEFVQMMMLDGCFVVELLCLIYEKLPKDAAKGNVRDSNINEATHPHGAKECGADDKQKSVQDVEKTTSTNEVEKQGKKEYLDDPIFNTRWMVPNLQCDLFLLENQIPFNVLEKILEITKSDKEHSTTLEELALKFFEPLMPRQWKDHKKSDNTSPDHFLALCRSRFISPSLKEKTSESTQRVPHSIYCATELKEAGIKFKKRHHHDLFDIGFNNGILEIPNLLIDDQTGHVFLNFVAYEQCNKSQDPYFTHYLLFLDNLVNSAKDVELLHYNGIIDHVLGSDKEVAQLLNTLSKESIQDVNNWYLSKELKDINDYYNKKCNKWRAQLKHVYFSNPWAYFSFAAAIFLLILTVVQTFFSVYSYVRPN